MHVPGVRIRCGCSNTFRVFKHIEHLHSIRFSNKRTCVPRRQRAESSPLAKEDDPVFEHPEHVQTRETCSNTQNMFEQMIRRIKQNI